MNPVYLTSVKSVFQSKDGHYHNKTHQSIAKRNRPQSYNLWEQLLVNVHLLFKQTAEKTLFVKMNSLNPQFRSGNVLRFQREA